MAILSNIITPTNVLTATSTNTITNKTIDATQNTFLNLPGGSEIIRVARTSNTALAASNNGNLIDITSGTFTQTFVAAATLGNGWFAYIQNSGTGDITLDPSGAETIDGLTSYIMYPGEVRLVQCDGTALRTIVVNAFYRTFTASGTFTKPPGYLSFGGVAWSAGASGEKNTTTAKGGSGGGCFPFAIPSAEITSSTSVIIGAGGAATTTATRNAGGNTSLDGFFTIVGASDARPGAVARLFAAAISTSSVSSVCFGFETTTVGSTGSSTIYGGGMGHTSATNGSSSYYGGASGGSYTSSVARLGGSSFFGGNGGDAGDSTNGVDGVAPGGGGGATQTGASSGAGARGELRIFGVI